MAGSADYQPATIEPKWQAYWKEHRSFRALPAEEAGDRPKRYILDMFPYPSGAGLHVGHIEGYTATDILARTARARGENVLRPMGWDAFGLPTEQFAIKTGTHPREATETNVAAFRRQLDAVGFFIDWEREVNTTDPAYVRWTQWIFLQLFRLGLAYVDEKPVWWCPELRAVLANEEVADGKSEIGGHPVERRNMRQWVLRITACAEDLLAGLEGLDWPDSTKKMQAAWIGRSEGAKVRFAVEGESGPGIEVFTTRPDTLFGATYMVLAPEHKLVERLTTPEQRGAVDAYVAQAARKSDLDRTDLAKEKTGVFTGAFAINPVNDQRVPIWVADYVLASYGTGAIMAVPAHDDRDYEFAQQYDLPIQPVIEPDHEAGQNGSASRELPYTGPGRLVHSDGYSGMPWDEAKAKIAADLEAQGRGEATVTYKLRDWLFSRQRYWGEPFPIVWVTADDYARVQASATTDWAAQFTEAAVAIGEGDERRYAVPLPESALPVQLPEVESYKPAETGESPLAKATDWVNVWLNVVTGETRSAAEAPGDAWVSARRETNTMPQWAGSCWYYLRYCDPANAERLIGQTAEAYWKTPDIYVGGAEHAVLHLLYARFWHHILYRIGVVTTKEPFPKLFHQGIILGEDGQKMSKSVGNVINPDEVIADAGADTLRLYEMFMGPLEDMKPWNRQGIEGIRRFLRKVYREFTDRDGNLATKVQGVADDADTKRLRHETVRKVSEDIDGLRFNTAISQMMIFSNHLQKVETISRETAQDFLRLLAPFAPHLAEELWERTGGSGSILDAGWPTWDPAALVVDEVKVIFQVNGKLRGQAMLLKGLDQETTQAKAMEEPKVAAQVEGKTIRKVIHIPDRLLNIVAS